MDHIVDFNGGMNWDWSPIAVGADKGKSPYERGDYRYMLNMRGGSSESEFEGAIENLRGHALIANPDLPSGTNTVIGSTLDRTHRRLYYFVHNSNSQHGIFRFNLANRTIEKIIVSNVLNFNLQYRITGSYVRDNLLYFTDNFNPPRQIDVEVIKTIQSVSEFYLSLIKYRPPSPLRITSVDEVGQNKEVQKGVYMFTYRYVYINGMKSRCAPFTSIASNEYGNSENQGLISPEWDRLDIRLRGYIFNSTNDAQPYIHNNADVRKYIDRVEILMREEGQLSWQLIRTIKMDTFNEFFSFKNTTRVGLVSDTEVNEGQDYVPLKSETLESIDNRIMLGNNTEDFPEVSNFKIEGQKVYQAADNTLFASRSTGDYPTAPELANRFLHNKLTFKEYGTYQIGIVFHDEAGRSSLAYTDETCRFYIDSKGNNSPYFGFGFKFASTFTPPIWATSYSIVRSQCLNKDYFVTAPIDGIKLRKQVDTDGVLSWEEAATYSEASAFFFDVKNWAQSTYSNAGETEQNPINNINYTYEEGHRIQFFFNGIFYDFQVIGFEENSLVVSKPNTDISNYTNIIVSVYNPVKENETVVFYECGEWYPILNPKTAQRNWSKADWTWTSNSNIIAYTLPNSEKVFRNYPLINGDCHALTKRFYITHNANFNPPNFLDFSIQSMNPDPQNIAGTWIRGNGRPNVAYLDPPKQITRGTQVRFSNKFVTDGLLNYSNQFDPFSSFIYPAEYGPIRKLLNANNQSDRFGNEVLLAIHERESISIYINRRLLQDVGGNNQIGLSDKVLGSYNTLLGSFGTLNPESVVGIDGRAYWWDATKGDAVRYSRDGLTPISAFFMRNYFNDISQLLIDKYNGTTNPRVISTYDYYHDELIMSFEHSSLPATFKGYSDYKTIVWNEESNNWKSFASFKPEHLAYISNYSISFLNGQLYMNYQGADDSFGDFYGTKYDSYVEPIINPAHDSRKVFESIRIASQDKWNADRLFTDVLSGGKTRQQSNIPLSLMVEKEGDFYSAIGTDINTGNGTSTGEKMRGKYLQALLKLDPDVDYLTALYYIQVRMVESKKN